MIKSKKILQPIYLLSPTKVKEIIHLPMIDFETMMKPLALGDCDTLLFTSKQAVKSADKIDKRWKEYPCIAIGKATAKEIECLGGSILYHSTEASAKSLAQTLATSFTEKAILYLRPKKVSFNIKTFLEVVGIDIKEQIIYQTSCLTYPKDKQPPVQSIIIFTSPSTIECFLKHFIWDESYSAIVIGETTKVHLPLDCQVYVSDEPLITSCIQKAKEIRDKLFYLNLL